MLTTNITIASSPLSVIQIEVEQLFGRYSYSLHKEKNRPLSSSLLILYGDNGSGKTTVLKLLFHLLSPAKKRGHLTFLAQTPFKSFSVTLADGTYISTSRPEGKLIGSFQIKLRRGHEDYEEKIKVNSDNLVKDLQTDEFYKKLYEIQLNLFFLGDDRILMTDSLDEDIENTYNAHIINDYSLIQLERRIKVNLSRINPEERFSALKTSIERTEEWVRQQALKGSNQGAVNVHSVYEGILDRIMSCGEAVKEELPHTNEKLLEELHTQEDRSKKFSHFGLMSPLNNQKIARILQQNPTANHSIIWNVLKPYLDSVTARMDALEETQKLLRVFVDTINQSFFRGKKIRLHVQEGLSIVTDEGEKLSSEMLSSGEKQLLLLFCNTLTARDKATIFIIDEPELSLNIKWQRQLIRALLDLTKKSQVQFILATHSIELLSQYQSNVVKLENRLN